MYTPYPLPTRTCPSRQAKALTCSGGTVRRSLPRPTPSLNPPYHSDFAPHAATVSSVRVPPNLSLSGNVWGRCFGFCPALSDRPATLRDGVGRSISLPTRPAPDGLPAWTKSAPTNSPPANEHRNTETSCTASLPLEVAEKPYQTCLRRTTAYSPLPA